jgi:hypothetical protein
VKRARELIYTAERQASRDVSLAGLRPKPGSSHLWLVVTKRCIKCQKWAANQSILRGVKALAIELGLKSKENQMITVSDL